MKVFDPKELDLWLPALGARGTCPVQERFSVAGIFNICSYNSCHIRALGPEYRSVSMLWRTLGPKVMHELEFKEQFYCDHPRYDRSRLAFTRKDHCRDRLRDYLKEDIRHSIPGKHCADLLILDLVDTSPKASMVMVHADLDTSSFSALHPISKQTKTGQAASANHTDGCCGNGTGTIDAIELGCAQPPGNHKDDQPYQPVPESSEAVPNIPKSLTRKTLGGPEFKWSIVKSSNSGVITAVKYDVLEHVLKHWLQNSFGSAATYEVCDSVQREA